MAKEKNALIRTRTTLVVLLAMTAFCSNPDLPSFQRWLGRNLASDSGWARIPSSTAAELLMASAEVEYTSFGFCSAARIYQPQKRLYVGCFGNWYRVRMSSTVALTRMTDRTASKEGQE